MRWLDIYYLLALQRRKGPTTEPRFDTNPPPTLAVDDLDMRLIVFDLDLHLLPL